MKKTGISFNISDLQKGLESLESRSDIAIRAFAETGAQKLQNEAKINAKWTDRSGRARASLNSGAEKRYNKYVLRLAHGVDYGIYLEFAHEKRFAIIFDTIRYVGTFEIMPVFKKLLERL